MKNIFFTYLLLVTFFSASAQKDSGFIETAIVLQTKTAKIYGTLTMPTNGKNVPVALIIAGSGPTDRNGNSVYTKNDCLQKLAHQLSYSKIASVRFDKREIGKSIDSTMKEGNLRFDTYVNDAKDWISFLKKDSRFTKIIVIGHSEGSLIGMIAAQNADIFISIAGAGQPADKIIKTQLASQPKQVQDIAFPIIDSLKNGMLVTNIPTEYYSIFRPSVQPYLISWFKYDPAIQIKNLHIPILIIQGTNDLQVTVDDAKLLAAANPSAKSILIDKMNHVFRIIATGDTSGNIASYKNPELPISDELVKNIVNFIAANN
jgi:alpha/beta superfamily hydrolase